MSARTPAGGRSPEFALELIITLVAIGLVVVTWAITLVSIGTEEREAQAHAQGNVGSLALTVEWQLRRQLHAMDEAMLMMAADWRADPARFDPAAARRRVGLPDDRSVRVALLDDAGRVVASTEAGDVGADESGRGDFQGLRAARQSGLVIAPAIAWKAAGGWRIDLSRRLEHDDGGFAGAIVVSYDPWVMTARLEQVELGPRGLIALVGDDGAMRALVSPYEVRPGTDISGSAMFRDAVRAGLPTWIGPSAPDGVVRVHALRRIRDQDLTIVVATDAAVAMRGARAFAGDARTVAGCLSIALLVMAWLLVRECRKGWQREEWLAESKAGLEAANAELAAADAGARRRAAELEATLSGMSDGVMLLDASLRLAQWNERFPAFTGTPPDILRVGLPMEAILRAQAEAGEFGAVDVEAEVAARMARLRAHAGVSVTERTRPNGRTLEARRAALPDGGVVTLYIDVTARKQAEEAHARARRLAEEAMEHKSRFVAVVSHEIRTPLNAVVNSLALLDQSNLSQAQHALAETARDAAETLLDLVRDVLDLTQADAPPPAARPVGFALADLLEGVRDMCAPRAAARRVRLLVEVAPGLPPMLRGDRGRLRQVMLHLVGNAAKFTDPGIVTIRAAATAGPGPAMLRLVVRDQGPRIPQAAAARLFQPFSRLENAEAGATPGTGLGLAICERLVRLMGGRIGLAATPEGGNEFWVMLPLEAAEAAPEPAAVLPLTPPPRARRAAVLVVEDLVPNQVIAATILRRAGHRVDIAESGAEALRLVQARPYDLILMDLVMPGMSGFEATRRIRALPPPAGAIPIVALTATTAPEDRAGCFALGMLEVLPKPVRPADLLATVARVGGGLPVPGAAVAAPQAEGKVLDADRLAELCRGLSLATVAPMVEDCLADIRQRLPLLLAALRVGEARAIEEAAHTLAGMAGNFALVGIEARMRRIMAAIKARDIAAARAAGEGAEDELLRSGEAIRLALRAAA